MSREWHLIILLNSALYQANTLVKSGMADCALALGFEQMAPGSLGTNWKDRIPPMAPWGAQVVEYESATGGTSMGPMSARMFGNGAKEYCDKFGATTDHLAKIGEFGPRQVIFDILSWD